MRSAVATITNSLGLHARPAMAFVQTANGFQSSIRVTREGGNETVDGKSIMQMLLLAVTQGGQIRIEVEGPDEVNALAALAALVESKFGEA